MSIGYLLMRAEGTPLQVGDSIIGFNKLAYLTVGDIALRCKRSASVDVSSQPTGCAVLDELICCRIVEPEMVENQEKMLK